MKVSLPRNRCGTRPTDRAGNHREVGRLQCWCW